MNSYAGNLQAPTPTPAPNTSQAYGNLFSGISNLGNTYGGVGPSVLPFATQTAFQQYNNPFAGQAVSGAQTAGNMGTTAAGNQFTTGESFLPYATSIMNTGMDPQSALYARTLQQVQDQSRAANEAAGVATTPYGAGVEGQNVSNFNIDWQNSQLQREIAAAQGAGGLATTGSNLASSAVPLWAQSAALPYSTSTGIAGGQNTALSNLLGIGTAGANLSNLPISDWNSYLQTGNQTNQVANQAFSNQLNQSQLGWNQMMQLGSGIGSLFAAPFTGGLSLGMTGPGYAPYGTIGYGSGNPMYAGPVPQ